MAQLSTSSVDANVSATMADDPAEMALLGALLHDRELIREISQIVTAEDFAQDRHKALFQTMLDLWERREPSDFATLGSEMIRRGLGRYGDLPEAYLVELMLQTPYVCHAPFYARRVLDMADRRRVSMQAHTTATRAAWMDDDLDAIVDEAAAGMRSARHSRPAGRYTFLGDVEDDVLTHQPRIRIGGVFAGLESFTGGFEPGQLTIVAARPSVGKSAVVIQWLWKHAVQTGQPVGLVSLEMHRRDVRNRIVSMATGINVHMLRSGVTPLPAQEAAIERAGDALSGLPFVIDDDPDTTLAGVVARAKAMVSEQRVTLLGIDYLQLMSVPGMDNRVHEVSRISAAMKQLARELSIPVVVLAQLNRGVEMRPDAEPRLSDLRDSGSVEQDADIVILMHRVNDKGGVQLNVGKNRNGPVGFVKMRFVKETASFTEGESS